MKESKKIQILRIVKFLEENPNTFLREIARNLNLNPAQVHRALKEIGDFIMARSIDDGIVDVPLPNLPVMIRLKDGVTAEGILRFLEIKEKINRSRI